VWRNATVSVRALPLLVPALLLAPTVGALTLLAPPETETFLVGHAAGVEKDLLATLRLLGLRVEALDDLDVLRVTGPVGLDKLVALPGVTFVERDAAARIAGAQWNGAQWNGAQWDGAQWDGERVAGGSTWGHEMVGSEEAWGIETGARGAELCVVDSGVDWWHPDLVANARVEGLNALTGATDAGDDAGHGTHVAGIAAAARGNGVGVAGVSQSTILSAKVFDRSGHGKLFDLAEGMTWCANQGADVVLLALSVDGESQTIRRALDHLDARDVVVVASAGNTGPCSSCVAFPARDPRVLAVAAVAEDGSPAPFSAQGPEVDLRAPGVGILSTFDQATYASGSGTSQAAAWVAGAAVLVREHRGDLTAAQVRQALVAGSEDGLLDVAGALRAAEG
jgi:subtilisin family serine protease